MDALPTLRQARERACVTQEELAAVARISARTVQRIELEQVDPHLSTRRVLAVALRLHPSGIAWPSVTDERAAA